MKMTTRWLAVGLLLTSISIPVALMAVGNSTGAVSTGPIAVPTPPGYPTDGNPTGPPRVVAEE